MWMEPTELVAQKYLTEPSQKFVQAEYSANAKSQ